MLAYTAGLILPHLSPEWWISGIDSIRKIKTKTRLQSFCDNDDDDDDDDDYDDDDDGCQR